MKRIPLIQSLLIFMALLVPEALTAQQIVPGEGEWMTLETEHFRIYYSEEYRSFALRMGRICERVRARIGPVFNVGPEPTHVALVFRTDTVNAFATPQGYNRIVLYLDSPRSGDFARYDLWAEMLFVHEYTHILTTGYRGVAWYPFFFLTLGIPSNALTPSGFSEGISVHEESRAGRGRQNDPLTRMIVRTAVLHNMFPDPGEILAGSHRWPHGSIPYLYGGRLMKFLAENISPQSPVLFWRSNSFPLALNNRVLEIAGTYYSGVYRRLREAEEAYFRKEGADLRSRGVTPFRRLTTDGERKSFLYLNERGEPRYFAAPGASRPGLYGLGEDGRPELLRHINSVRGFAEGGGRRIYSEDYYAYPLFGIRYELYDADHDWILRRLRPEVHASYPSLSHDGRDLYYIERDGLNRRLVHTALEGTAEGNDRVHSRTLLEAGFTGILQYTALSPDGNKLVTLLRRSEKGDGELVLCERRESGFPCRSVLAGPGTKTAPRFSPDGRSIVFSSDADGVYNLYSLEPDSGKVLRLTRGETGYFFPAPAAKKLYALRYFPGGYDLVELKYEELLRESVDYFKPGSGPLTPRDDAVPGPTETKQEKLPAGWKISGTGGPLSMVPFFTGIFNGFGLVNLGLAAEDPLFRHSFLAGVGYDQPRPLLFGFYSYQRYRLGLLLDYISNLYNLDRGSYCHFRRDPVMRTFCEEDTMYSERGEAYLQFIDQGRTLLHRLRVGYTHTKLRNAQLSSTVEYDARDLNLSGPSIIYQADTTFLYPESISPEHGLRVSLEGQYYNHQNSKVDLDPATVHEVEFGVLEGGLALYLPSFFPNHVNYLGAYGYTAVGPDRTIQKVRLSRFMRGQNYALSEPNISAAVLTYEYRLPLLWLSREVVHEDMIRTMIDGMGMSVFFDYGASFDKKAFRQDWVGSYGITLNARVTLFAMLPLDARIVIARGLGPAGEGQVYLVFEAGLQSTFSKENKSGRSPTVLDRRYTALPGHRQEPGYFRNPRAGGILE